MANSKVRSPFQMTYPNPPFKGTMDNPSNGEGFPEEVTYRGDLEWWNGTPFVNVPAKPGTGRDSMRSPFENPKIGSKAKRD